MLRLLSTLFLIFSFLLPAQANPTSVNPAPNTKLDNLMQQLKSASTAQKARQVERQIWITWSDSVEERIRWKMLDAKDFVTRGLPKVALERLSEIIREKPKYVDAWNRRATLHYMMGEYEASMIE